jgi:hypothetical protein
VGGAVVVAVVVFPPQADKMKTATRRTARETRIFLNILISYF